MLFFDRKRWIVALVVLSSFGPYLMSVGLRLEHVVIYGLSAIALADSLSCRANPIRAPLAVGIFLPLAMSAAWSTFVIWRSPLQVNPVLVMASLDNYLQPTALCLLLAWGLARATVAEIRACLILAYRLMLLLLALNTMLAFSQMFVDTWPLVQFFVQGEPVKMGTVWQRAAAQGRYSGIFNQPIEAGIAYGLGLFVWGALFLTERRLSHYHFALLFMVLVGGLLSISKAFLMLAIPLFAGWVLFNRRELALDCFRAAHGWFAMGFMATLVVILDWNWKGVNHLKKSFGLADRVGSSGIVSRVTGKRFDSADSNVPRLIREVAENTSHEGFGFGLRRGFDNGYMEFYYQGGAIGLVFYLSVLAFLGVLARRVSSWSRSEGSMLYLILIFVVLVGIGGSVLTANRSSILLWVLLILFVEIDARQSKAGKSL